LWWTARRPQHGGSNRENALIIRGDNPHLISISAQIGQRRLTNYRCDGLNVSTKILLRIISHYSWPKPSLQLSKLASIRMNSRTFFFGRVWMDTLPFALSMRLFALAAIPMFFCDVCFAQAPTGSFRWALQAGGSGVTIQSKDVAVDAGGIVHWCGRFSGVASFGGTNLTATSGGDGFVGTFDQTGNLLWIRQMGGTGGTFVNGMAVDGSGNSFVAGISGQNLIIGTSNLSSGSYVAKYDSAGNVLWVSQFTGYAVDASRAAVDGAGNVYMCGQFAGTNQFSVVTMTNYSLDFDQFIAKFDGTDGAVQWVQRAGGNANGALGSQSAGVAADVLGNSYILGTLNGNVKFGNTNIFNVSGTNTFLAKYDTNGNLVWIQQFTGGVVDFSGLGLGSERGCAVDAAGNIYIASIFQGVAACASITLTNSTGYGVLIAKFNTDGDLLWAQQTRGTATNDERNLAVDSQGNVILAGVFNGTTTFGNTTLTTRGAGNIFVAKYDTDGNFLWAMQAGGSDNDAGFSVAANACGDAFVTGSFAGVASFGNISLTSLGGGTCIFLTRIDVESPALGVSLVGNQTVISWPFSSSECFQLYQSAGVGPMAAWTLVNATATQIGNSYTVTNQLSKSTMFYTLQRPPPY
jgi:hypothetical protein